MEGDCFKRIFDAEAWLSGDAMESFGDFYVNHWDSWWREDITLVHIRPPERGKEAADFMKKRLKRERARIQAIHQEGSGRKWTMGFMACNLGEAHWVLYMFLVSAIYRLPHHYR